MASLESFVIRLQDTQMALIIKNKKWRTSHA